MKVTFLTHLDTRQRAENVHELITKFQAQIEDKENKVAYAIIIDKGFVTDFASVPRLPFAYMLYGGLGNKAAVIHDALYSCWSGVLCVDLRTGKRYEYERKWADEVFLYALETCGINWFKRTMMYSAVRVFGGNMFKND